MRKIRYSLRLVLAFLSRFKGLILIGFVLGILLFVLFRFIDPIFFGRSTQKIGISGRYHAETLPRNILEQIGDGLTTVDDTGTAIPALAEFWETPDKGKTWIFTLKDDIYWQDGEEVASESIVYDFADVEIEYPDEKTIIFKLKEPFIPFPVVVSRPTFRRGLLGTGQYRVDKVSVTGSFIQSLALSENSQSGFLSFPNKIIYKFYPTEESLKIAFKLGEVDKLEGVLNPSPFTSWGSAEVVSEPNRNQGITIFFNNEDKLLGEKSLRQALIYAIDKTSGLRSISPNSPDSWAFNPQVKKYPYDVERARELIEELPEELREDLSINLVSTPTQLLYAEEIANYWNEVGIETTVQVSSVIPNEFQAYITIYDIPIDPDQYNLWHSTQFTTNISKYRNDRIDKLLEDGRLELVVDDRRKIYLDFQRFLVEDSPAAFLYHPETYTIIRS